MVTELSLYGKRLPTTGESALTLDGLGENIPDGCHEDVSRKRLDQLVLARGPFIRMPGHVQHFQLRTKTAEFVDKIGPGLERHPHVRDQEVDFVAVSAEQVLGLTSVPCLEDLEPFTGQDSCHQLTQSGFVIREQDDSGHGASQSLGGQSCRAKRTPRTYNEVHLHTEQVRHGGGQ